MRLFFAAFPDGECRAKLSAAARALRLAGAPAYLAPEKYHITLLFLGSVPDQRVDALCELGESQRSACTSLRFVRWEYWREAGAVVATTPDRPEPLLSLRTRLTAGLTQCGVALDDKPLRPHITVARKLSQAPVLAALSAIDCTLRSFSLVSSVTSPRGSVYTVVATWPLLDTAAPA